MEFFANVNFNCGIILRLIGQENQPIIKDFGKVFTIENPDLLLKKNKVYIIQAV